MGSDLAHEALHQAVESEVLPGAEGDVNVAEASGIGPGDGPGNDLDRGDGTGVRREHIADLLLETRQPGRVRQACSDAEPIGRPQVVQATEVTDGALAHGARGRARGFHQRVVGVGPPVACLVQSAKEHADQCNASWGTSKGRVQFSTLQGFSGNSRWQLRAYGRNARFLGEQVLNLG